MTRGSRQAFNTKFKSIKREDANEKRTVGFGKIPDLARIGAAASLKEGLGDIIDAIQQAKGCPIWNMPVIEQTRGTLLGPASAQTVSQFFGAEIRPFDWTNSTTGFDYVETTMAQSGELQTHTLACAIGWHIEIDPQHWTADGNGISIPETATAAPPSPDVFTANDVNNGALNTGAFVFNGEGEDASTIVPAFLEWGWWASKAAWFMVRGYDLQWKIGQHTNIIEEVLRNTAYMPPNAQEGSASDSEVDIARMVRLVNDRYEKLGSSLFFAKVNRIRIGSVGTAPNLGIFRPSRDHQRVGVTYGGGDLRSMLKGNSEFRQLTVPYMISAGIPIGLLARVNDETQADLMREYLSITQTSDGSGTIPPIEVDANNLSSPGFFDGTGAGNVGLERTFDGFNVPQQVPFDNAIFKGGELKVSLLVKGFEVTEDWFNLLRLNPALRDAVMCECGCQWAKVAA
jgi:hypothetical protein